MDFPTILQNKGTELLSIFDKKCSTLVKSHWKLFSFEKVANDFHLPQGVAGVYSLLIMDQRNGAGEAAHTGILDCNGNQMNLLIE